MEGAMQKTQDKYEFKVTWEPFFLRPDMPEEGRVKPPNTPDNPRVGARLKAAGEAVGIDFSGKSDVAPNTTLTHTLMEYALKEDPSGKKQNELQEIMFKAYFTDGTPIDINFLVHCAESVGLNKEAAKAYLEDPENRKRVARKALDWSVNGVSGVPTFFMNKKRAFSGAQDEASFIQVFDLVSKM